jgi:hypothetical protein
MPPQIKVVDSSLGDNQGLKFTYAYAPYMVLEKNSKTVHAFYCSTSISNLGMTNWDAVRYSVSQDAGKTWSVPKVALAVSDPVNERAACDPSVFLFNGYYYMYYSGNQENTQTVILLARSKSIAGPYEKWTNRGTWEVNAHDPKILIAPRNPTQDGAGGYGAGQTTQVVKDGIIHLWHNDDSAVLTNRKDFIYYQNTTDPTKLTKGIPTNVTTNDLSAGSVDVKYDPINDQFVMFSIRMGHYQQAKIIRRTSKDGITWSGQEVFCDENCTPDFINNIGALGTQEGYLLPGTFIGYGVPYDLRTDCAIQANGVDKNCWGYWDIFGAFYSSLNEPGGRIVGTIDAVQITSQGYRVHGWACSYGANTSINVHIYAKDPVTGAQTGVGIGTANIASSDGVGANCGTTLRQHRFSVTLPPGVMSLHHGKQIVVYGISPYKLNNNALSNSGAYSLPQGQIDGFIDGAVTSGTNLAVSGWSCAKGSNLNVNVHIYVADAAGTKTMVASGLANLTSEPAIASACENTAGNNRYKVYIPLENLKPHKGKRISVYGISPYGMKNELLHRSGEFVVP